MFTRVLSNSAPYAVYVYIYGNNCPADIASPYGKGGGMPVRWNRTATRSGGIPEFSDAGPFQERYQALRCRVCGPGPRTSGLPRPL